MKQLSLLALLCLFAAGAGASTFSGTVTNASTSAPIASQKVFIIDSSGSSLWRDSTLTNSSGQYSFTLPASVASGHFLLAYTTACGAVSYSWGTYSGSNMTGQNFSVCAAPPSAYTLKGIVSGPLDSPSYRNFKVYLIRKAYDPVAADTTLTAIDSIAVTGTTYFSKGYSAIPSGTLLLKVALLPGDSQYSNFLPTYYDSSLQWSSAKVLTSSNFTGWTNVYMKAGTNPGGPGFIGGSVLLGANKSTGAGDPLAQRIIIITNAATGKAVGYTYSDAAGHFQFPSLAYGTYKLFGDVWGKNNPALTVTLSASNGTVNNVLFRENKKDFTGQIGGLGVNSANPLLAGIFAYPNPAKDYVEVGGIGAISGDKTITLSAVNGAVIARQEAPASGNVRIATASLAPGIYILRVQTDAGVVEMKITK